MVRARRGLQSGRRASSGACDGWMRTPNPGSNVSGAALRTVVQASPVFIGSTKLPAAFSWRRIVSPGRASSSAF